ncbi:toxin-antitoxin system YwqK family antitoxin [Fulvivirga maritima]|uniref:toxin-antitoxin system YwqK family antitoxin n=1 Tax=Fulvivirga maritima TaxID=2904247 RepID=UPI001F358A5D|nr:toxin-antitoxin system YwqK family antitoxin [Fulvivirga maritima]UII26410.1 toxin-antitoxin system YwqK family antitoxin [Fulvivirga maritima]
MTRSEQLQYCKICQNRMMDSGRGLVCKLTNDVADFDQNCADFRKDEHEARALALRESELNENIKSTEIIADLNDDLIERLREHQDLTFALVGGFAACLLSALLWAVITVATQFQIGYMAIGVGLIVGLAVRYFGAGVDKLYGVIGAIFALLGCVLGNLFSQIGFYANDQMLSYFDVFKMFSIAQFAGVVVDNISPIDFLFYGIALIEGYKFSFRNVSGEERINMSEDPEYVPYPSNQKLRAPLAISLFVVITAGVFIMNMREAHGTQTFYYDDGAKLSSGEMLGGKLNGNWSYYYENGNVSHSGEYQDGVQSGNWLFYDELSNLILICNYEKGLLHGSYIKYHYNGNVSDSGQYKNGRMENDWAVYSEAGALLKSGQMKRDKPYGAWKAYYDNGNLLSQENYNKEGMLDGKATYYYANGEIMQEVVYHGDSMEFINYWDPKGQQLVKDGNGQFIQYYDDGNVNQKGLVKNGYKVGLWEVFYQDGTKMQELEFVRPDLSKINQLFNDKGEQIVKDGEGDLRYFPTDEGALSSGHITKGLKDGKWEIYTADALFLMEQNYDMGVLEGEITTYFTSQVPNSKGVFKNNKKTGDWVWYFENGMVESEVTFVDDKKHGEQKFYDEGGTLLKTEKYEKGQLVDMIIEI